MKNRQYITILLLMITLFVAFGLPKPKHVSPDVIGNLNIPITLTDWRSRDVSDSLGLERADDRYNFVSDVFARQYVTRYKESLLFLVLDAGNFHHPKVCFGSSGYQVSELSDTLFSMKKRSIATKTLYAKKDHGGFIIIYWMVIDGKVVDWTEQKFKELFLSIVNKPKTRLMMRIDIPVEKDNVDYALNIAQKFIRDLKLRLSREDLEYMFGM